MKTLQTLSLFSSPLLLTLTLAGFTTAQNRGRMTDSLIALYDLDEGTGTTVHDTSSFGTPTDLRLIPGHVGNDVMEKQVHWIVGGLSITDNTSISSQVGDASKINQAIVDSKDLTIEAWIKSENNTLRNADIVVMGRADDYNFLLSQGGTNYEGDGNNNNPNWRPIAGPSVVPMELQHVVYTWNDDSKTANFFIDNVNVNSNINRFNSYRGDPNLPLSFASRLDAMRPWFGEIHMVALYNKALDPFEVDQNYRDGLYGCSYIERLYAEINSGTNQPVFDLNDDGAVDSADVAQWQTEASAEKMRGFSEPLLPGDTNLDGLVNATDLNVLALNWQIDNATSWCQADFNHDGQVNASDLNDIGLNWESDIRGVGAPHSASVPEPDAFILAALALPFCLWTTGRHLGEGMKEAGRTV